MIHDDPGIRYLLYDGRWVDDPPFRDDDGLHIWNTIKIIVLLAVIVALIIATDRYMIGQARWS